MYSLPFPDVVWEYHVFPACLPWGATSPISIPCFIFLPHLDHTSGKRMHRNKQLVIQTLRGNQHRVLSGNCSQPDWCAPGTYSLLRRRDFSCVSKASCCIGICNTALHVENSKGMQGPKKRQTIHKR